MEQLHPTTSKRKWKQLTEKDRYHLEAYFNAGMRTQEIAERMGYSKRTINKDLLQKKKEAKQAVRKVRKVAWNNRAGKSIEETRKR